MSTTSYTTGLGHLAFTRKLVGFRAANENTYFVIPINLGKVPTPLACSSPQESAVVLAIDASAAVEKINPYQGRKAQSIFKDKQQQYKKFLNPTIALRSRIIRPADNEHIKVHKDKLTRYAKTTLLTLTSHLLDTYRGVAIVNLKANKERIQVQWNPLFPIESLFLKLEEGQELAQEGNEVITNSYLIQVGYGSISATGQVAKYCAKWLKRS